MHLKKSYQHISAICHPASRHNILITIMVRSCLLLYSKLESVLTLTIYQSYHSIMTKRLKRMNLHLLFYQRCQKRVIQNRAKQHQDTDLTTSTLEMLGVFAAYCIKHSIAAVPIQYCRTHTSGAMQSGVPQKVLVVTPSFIFSLHMPKSAILMWPSQSSITLSSFRSLQEGK